MNRVCYRLLVFVVLGISSFYAQATLTVVCDQMSCKKSKDDQTLDLLFRFDESTPVKLHWRSPTNPVPENYKATLYAGNPAIHDKLPNRGVISFEHKKDRWQASYKFEAEELGRGTFIAVVVLHSLDDQSSEVSELTNPEIIDWRAFRLLTDAERKRRRAIPKPTSSWSLHIEPALLRVTSARGDLPRSRGGDQHAWWSLADAEGNYTDLDIDGEHNGVPGLGIQVATPWHTRVGDESWQDKIKNNLKSIDGHEVNFGELQWIERPDREVDIGGELSPVLLRHYYTVISLYTNASMRSFTEDEVGAFNFFTSPRYFSHETSAKLNLTDDPRFWSSYSKREYGNDQDLLKLLKYQVQSKGNINGLTMIQSGDGDGGDVTYHVGFYGFVRPWEKPADMNHRKFRAGLVGLDVVAARGGLGRLITPGSAGQSGVQNAWCQIVSCNDTGNAIDLDAPPDGYRTSSAVANLRTLSGNLPIISGKPIIVERTADIPKDDTDKNPGLINLPDRARFGISANLRSGAVLQEAFWHDIENIMPINSYAQFVVKLTVAMHPETKMVENNDAHIPSISQFDLISFLPEPKGFFAWIEKHLARLFYVIIVVGIVSLFLFVPGLREFVSGIFSVLAGVLERIARGLGHKNR